MGKKAVAPFYRSGGWHKARSRALRRDRYCCVNCGADVRAKGASRVDHILPRKKFPELALHLPNLRTLCVACDNARHARDRAGNRSGAEAPIRSDGFPADGSWDLED